MSSIDMPPDLIKYIGWSRYSGVNIDRKLITRNLSKFTHFFLTPSFDFRIEANNKISFTEQINIENTSTNKPTAVLFGLGNYAKTIIIPSIRDRIFLQRVHEIDPYQLNFFYKNLEVSLDTCPYPRPNRKFDSWFIAGFHHMHTELALSAFKQSAYAVIEKPLSTSKSQYLNFLQALDEMPNSRFFLCFQKRYSYLHKLALKDLGASPNLPIDVHCIVYEIPLPTLHWYNWPNSGSRLISNGCHWIDYFLFVNNYCDVVDCKKWQPRGMDVVVQIKLSNGAYFTMTLTDTGSQRLGVRDYIELRHGGVTVTIIDGAYYFAENRKRIIRKTKVNPLDAYRTMYQKISHQIVMGGKGDCRNSLKSSEITLLLEELK